MVRLAEAPPLDIRLSEVHEYFIATVLMVYLWSFYLRLRQFETRGQGGGAQSPTGTVAKAGVPPLVNRRTLRDIVR